MRIIIKLSRKKALKFARHLRHEHPRYSKSLKLKGGKR